MNFEDLIAKVKTCGKQKLAVAAAEDDAVLEAVDAAHKQGIADAILVGDEAAIRKIAGELNIDLSDYENIAEDYSVLPSISGSVLTHTIGDPSSYPTKEYAGSKAYEGKPAKVDFTAAGGGSGIGFTTKQYTIPDYGSVNAGKLMDAARAQYTTSKGENIQIVGGNGKFTLQNGECRINGEKQNIVEGNPAEGYTVSLTINNRKGFTLPHTGADAPSLWLLIGLPLLVAGLLVLVFRYNRKGGKRS